MILLVPYCSLGAVVKPQPCRAKLPIMAEEQGQGKAKHSVPLLYCGRQTDMLREGMESELYIK